MLHVPARTLYGRPVGSRYSIVQNIGLMASVLPLAIAVVLVDTLDWYPYFLCAGAGVVLAVSLRSLSGRVQAGTAAFVAGEVAPRHAPGGFVLWLAPPLWCISLGLFANAMLDPSPARPHASEVLRLHRPNKGASKWILRGFRPGEAELAVREAGHGVARLEVGQAVTIVARDGLFGWTRVESITPR